MSTRNHIHTTVILYIAILCLWVIPNAHAQSLTQRDYDALTAKIMADMWKDTPPRGTRYTILRSLYSQTPYYDPFSKDTLKLINDLAEQITDAQTNNQNERLQTLQEFYKELISTQLGNFTIISRAWELARTNLIFGNHRFWNALRSGLFDSILDSGDGQSFRSAYAIITLDEETYLLKYLNYEVKDSLIKHKHGRFYFNIHAATNRQTGETSELHINTTIPTRFLARQKREEQSNAKPDLGF